MKLLTNKYDTSNGISDVVVEHDGESIDWSVKPYNRSKYCNREELFVEINNYIHSLPIDVQERIFNIYKEASFIINEEIETEKIKDALIPKITELYQLINLDGLEHYVRLVANIRLPPNLAETCEDDDPIIQQRTYVRNDYMGLVVLTVALKPMLPIWGSYMARMSEMTDNPFKEYDALGLLIKTDLIGCYYVARLRSLIAALLVTHNMPLSAKLSGLGSEEMPEYLLGLAMVRRLTLSPANAQPETGHLIAQVYRDVEKNVSTSLDKTFNGRVKEKHPMSGEREDEDKTSRAESYKEKQLISDGDKVTLSVYARQIDILLPKVLRGEVADPNVVKSIVEEMDATEGIDLTEGQRGIMMWVLSSMQDDGSPALTHVGTRGLDKKALKPAMAVCKIALHHWGFPQIAALITAKIAPAATVSPLAAGSATKLNKAALMQLIEIYPLHVTELTRKAIEKDPQALVASEKKNNPARVGIDFLTDLLLEHKWVIGQHDKMAPKLPSVRNRELTIESDIRYTLMELLLRIQNVCITI